MKASPSRRALSGVLFLAVAVAALPVSVFAADGARKPNLIMIMADDLGYETIGANGGTSYDTPVLDEMAAGGVRFEQCYVQPLCTPTRVQLMTGIYNIRNYKTFGDVDPNVTTFANLLKPAGYATCIVGKWQLGQDPGLPATFGFDEHCLWQHTRRPERYKNAGLEVNGKEIDYTNGEYGPELVNSFALDYIERKKDESFFLYYPMILTHSPYVATPDSEDYNKPSGTQGKKGAEDPHFGDMVEYMDKMIGRLTKKLDDLGIRENTLVIFIGDNGTGAGTRSMMGDRVVIGAKGKMNEYGMRVPCIASWPGTIEKGAVSTDLVDSTDFLPTLLEAAGVERPSNLDGRSFLPQLMGKEGNPRDWYYSWYAPREDYVGECAANQHYKLFRDGRFYDVVADPGEKNPLQVSELTGEAKEAARMFQTVLDQFADARPDFLPVKKGDPRADERPQPARRQRNRNNNP